MTLLHKVPVLEVKAVDDATGEIEGYGSTFGGEPDSYGDIIAAGAYAASLDEHRSRGSMPKMLWQHDRNEPIGKWLEAKEDDHGLWMRGKISLGLPTGAKAYTCLKDGCIDGLSIGYQIRKHEVDDETGVWTLIDVDLREVSVVTMPANEASTVANVKAARAAHEIMEKLQAGDRLTERELETLLKGSLGFSNSQAERAARVLLKGPGEPAAAADSAKRALLVALKG